MNKEYWAITIFFGHIHIVTLYANGFPSRQDILEKTNGWEFAILNMMSLTKEQFEKLKPKEYNNETEHREQ